MLGMALTMHRPMDTTTPQMDTRMDSRVHMPMDSQEITLQDNHLVHYTLQIGRMEWAPWDR